MVGGGYVGLTTAACLADLGNRVTVLDKEESKVQDLRSGRIPFFEPGLAEVVERNAKAGRLSFTTTYANAVPDAEFVFIAVGTPGSENGEANLDAVEAAAVAIAQHLRGRLIVVNKSTVPIGTGDLVSQIIASRTDRPVSVVSNPEFLREGSALRDFMEPDRIVIGARDMDAARQVARLYEPLAAPILTCDLSTAEMVKYASNAFLATRISFINMIARICEQVGADVRLVADGMGLDARIGSAFLDAGIGYGGSCLTGDETVLIRWRGHAELLPLARLYAELADGEACEVLAWRADAATAEFLPIAAATRRTVDGVILEVQTEMGRRVRCTTDHPFVTADGIKLAEQLTESDWVPLAQLSPPQGQGQPLPGPNRAEAPPDVAVLGRRDVIGAAPVRTHELSDSPSSDPGAGIRLETLDPCAGPHEHRLPNAIWDRSREEKLALLGALWRRDGSWHHGNGGQDVVLEYSTGSRELADGVLRLLGDLGVVGSLRVGRAAKSTCDTCRIRVSGADQVEQLLDLVGEGDRERIRRSIPAPANRAAPAGYRRGPAHTAWVRIAGVGSQPFSGAVYSLEVPGARTFVTTGGLVVHNCFPKDVKALAAIADRYGYHPELLHAVMAINREQRELVVTRLRDCLGTLRGRTVGLLGLAFKPNTDDLREAPSVEIAKWLLDEGAVVRGYDPVAMDRARELVPGLQLVSDAYAAAEGGDAVVIVTEWNEFRQLDLPRLRQLLRSPVLIDGRNIYDPETMRKLGFQYRGIGRGWPAIQVGGQTAVSLPRK